MRHVNPIQAKVSLGLRVMSTEDLGFRHKGGTIFPMGGKYIFVVNKELRAAAGVKGGDMISMTMERDEEPRIITPPADLARALKANKAAQAAWDKLSYTHKKEHARAVEDAKRPETRVRRIEKAVAQLAEGKKP